jgi:hypothetical protein
VDRKSSTHSKFMVSNEVCDNEINVAFSVHNGPCKCVREASHSHKLTRSGLDGRVS